MPRQKKSTTEPEAVQERKSVIFDQRTKGDFRELINEVIKIERFSVKNNDIHGEYVAFTVDDNPDEFYITGGQAIVEMFRSSKRLLNMLFDKGIKVRFFEVENKERTHKYIDIDFEFEPKN